MNFFRLFKEDSYGTFYFWQFVVGTFSFVASVLALCDFFMKKNKFILAPYITIFALGLVFLILFLKYRKLYFNVISTACVNGHLVVHNCLNTYFELQRILHKEILDKKPTDIDTNNMGTL